MKREKLTGKLMEYKLKQGWTVEDFAKYIECTKDEFIVLLDSTFHSDARTEITWRLEQNEKRKKKAKKSCKSKKKIKCGKTDNNKEVENIKDINLDENTLSVSEELTEMCEEEILSTDEILSTEEMIATLESKKENLRALVCKDESIRSKLFSNRQELFKKLTVQKEVVDDLKKKLETASTNITLICNEIDKIDTELPNVKERIDVTKKEIEMVEEEIAELKKLAIFVYESGEIEVEGIENVEIPNTWSEVFDMMIDNELVEELPIKQVKVLSKVLAYVKTLDRKFEITFELDALHNAYTCF